MKAKLTDAEVLEIFSRRSNINNYESNASTSKQLAREFNVSERTVRDIWCRRTRRDVTQHAWTLEEHLTKNQKKIGRPLGAKDGAPRQRYGPPSTSRLRGISETTSEADADPSDRSSSTDCNSLDGQSDVSEASTYASSDSLSGRNGLLFNEAVLALLKQGTQCPAASDNQPCPNGAGGNLSSRTFSSFNVLQFPATNGFANFSSTQQGSSVAAPHGALVPHASVSSSSSPSFSMQQPASPGVPPSIANGLAASPMDTSSKILQISQMLESIRGRSAAASSGMEPTRGAVWASVSGPSALGARPQGQPPSLASFAFPGTSLSFFPVPPIQRA